MTALKFISSLVLIAAIVFTASYSKKKNNEALPFYNTPDFTPQWMSSNDEGYMSIHSIAPFSFTNQSGTTISNKDVEGKIYVANFFFSRCGSICPKMNENLHKIAEAFATTEDVLILSHSVTPKADSVKQLKEFGERNHVNPDKWWLLTGDKEAIYAMARRSYFADETTGYNLTSKEFLHTENAVLVDRKGRIRGVYNATLPLEMEKLVKHIKILLQETD